MSFKNVDITSALRRVADHRIEQAMQQGKFDNLPGKGKPLNLDPKPAEENARLLWWSLRILKQNDEVPDEVRLRKSIDDLRDQPASAATATDVTRLVKDINAVVRQLNTLGTNALPMNETPVSLEQELARFRRRTS